MTLPSSINLTYSGFYARQQSPKWVLIAAILASGCLNKIVFPSFCVVAVLLVISVQVFF